MTCVCLAAWVSPRSLGGFGTGSPVCLLLMDRLRLSENLIILHEFARRLPPSPRSHFLRWFFFSVAHCCEEFVDEVVVGCWINWFFRNSDDLGVEMLKWYCMLRSIAMLLWGIVVYWFYRSLTSMWLTLGSGILHEFTWWFPPSPPLLLLLV